MLPRYWTKEDDCLKQNWDNETLYVHPMYDINIPKFIKKALDEIKKIKDKYPNFSGVFDWEYLNAPPDTKDPSQWAKLMRNSLNR